MEVSIHEVFERFRESGIVESPASEAVIKRALIEVYGEAFSTEKVFNYLMENGAWTLEAQARIHSILQNFEGQMVVHSEQQLAHARLVHAILNDTERWGLTEEQKMSIVKDRPLIQRWSNEFSEEDGFQHLLDYVVDDEIFEWKQAHPAKPSLDEMISSTNERKDNPGAHMFICLTANKEDRTWTAGAAKLERIELTGATAIVDDKNRQILITGPDAGGLSGAWFTQLSNSLYSSGRRDRMDYSMKPANGNFAGSMPFMKEQDYPVKVYFERTDMNGSGVMECESCSNRDELLSLLNWIGKAGFVPVECWDFSIEKMDDPIIQNMFQAGLQRRYEEAAKEIDAMLEDNWTPDTQSKKAAEMVR